MSSSSSDQLSSAGCAAAEGTRSALFIDAELFRGCAANAHERLRGSPTRPSQVNIDGEAITHWLTSWGAEIGLDRPVSVRERSPRRVYEILSDDRTRRWSQRRYHGVLEAEGLVVTATRRRNTLATSLATDLVALARERRTDSVLLFAADDAYASAAIDARRFGVDVVLLVAPASSDLVAGSLREAATRAFALHPEVFETLYHVG